MRLNQLISKLSAIQKRVGGEATVFVNVQGCAIEFLEVVDAEHNKDLVIEFGMLPEAVAAVIVTEPINLLGYTVVAIDDSDIDENGYGIAWEDSIEEEDE